MPLNQVTAMVSGQLRLHITSYHMSKLTPCALRILTELALAIDDRGIPIDYRRRRDLAAAATLIDDTTWARMTREAGMRLTQTASARRYLYELLTGCALATAPPPYRLSAGPLGSYNDFVLGIPASLATALTDHARRLLGRWGIGGEPLHWQPPDDWVTVTSWPGADPARTDPAPIHHALLNDETPPVQIATDLGISLGHLRQVLRRHPLPRPRRPVRYTLIPAPEPAARPPGQHPGVIYLDPDWLRQEYLTWHRSLGDIAEQAGCPVQTLNRFAHDHGIPVRTRGTSSYMPAASALGTHPRDLPEPLRSALIGPRARERLEHLLATARHPSILAAAPGTRPLASHPLPASHPARTRLRRPAHQPQPPPRRHRDPDPTRPASPPAGPRVSRPPGPQRVACGPPSRRNRPAAPAIAASGLIPLPPSRRVPDLAAR
jgi:hypothetical protein